MSAASPDRDAFHGEEPQAVDPAALQLETVNALLALPIERLALEATNAMDALDNVLADPNHTQEDVDSFTAIVEACQQALLAKPDRYVGLLEHLERQADTLKMEATRLNERRKRFERKADRLADRLLAFVQTQGGKIETNNHTITAAKKPARVEITSLERIPENFKAVIPQSEEIVVHPAHTEVNERAILAVLKSGKKGEPAPTVEGCELKQEYRLQIR